MNGSLHHDTGSGFRNSQIVVNPGHGSGPRPGGLRGSPAGSVQGSGTSRSGFMDSIRDHTISCLDLCSGPVVAFRRAPGTSSV